MLSQGRLVHFVILRVRCRQLSVFQKNFPYTKTDQVLSHYEVFLQFRVFFDLCSLKSTSPPETIPVFVITKLTNTVVLETEYRTSRSSFIGYFFNERRCEEKNVIYLGNKLENFFNISTCNTKTIKNMELTNICNFNRI